MSDQIFIQHRFTVEKDGYVLNDAIVLPQAEYEFLQPEEIETMKKERLDNFVAAINAPKEEVKETKEEAIERIDADLASIEEQKIVLLAMKEEASLAVDTEVTPVEIKPKVIK